MLEIKQALQFDLHGACNPIEPTYRRGVDPTLDQTDEIFRIVRSFSELSLSKSGALAELCYAFPELLFNGGHGV